MGQDTELRRPPVVPAGVPPRGASAASRGPRRHSPRTLAALLMVLAMVAACGAGGEGSPKDPADAARRDPQEIDAAQATVAENEAEPQEEEDAFVASGGSTGGEAGAADRIEGVRFRIFDDYERLIVDFGGGDPRAGVPRWTIESPEEGGYVRLRFPGIRSTRVAHESFVGSVLDEFYVVRDDGGGLFADVFALHAFRYRVMEFPESRRLAVDFLGVREEIDFPPTTSDKAVVVQPREAEEVGSPLTVEGYSRVPGTLTNVSLIDRDGEVIASTAVRAEGDADAWHPFTATLRFSGFEDPATLRVGGKSPRVGPRGVTFEGAQTEVFLE